MNLDEKDPLIIQLRGSVAWRAGTAYERRRIGEILRQRAIELRDLPGPTSRSVQTELRRLAEFIDQEVV